MRAVYGLKVDGVTRAIRHASGELVVVKDVSFVVPPGHVIGLTGPTDAGYRALLRVIAGLDARSAGTIELLPAPGAAVPPPFGSTLYRQEVLHAPAILPLVGSMGRQLQLQLISLAASRRRRVQAIDAASLRRLASVDPRRATSDLTLAERSRLGLALAWSLRPSHVLAELDGVSADDRDRAVDLLRRMAAAGVGVVLATQDEPLLASVASRILVFMDGEVAADGAPLDVIPAAVRGLARGAP